MRYREQGISRLGVGQVWMGALGVNVVGGSLCMDSRLKPRYLRGQMYYGSLKCRRGHALVSTLIAWAIGAPRDIDSEQHLEQNIKKFRIALVLGASKSEVIRTFVLSLSW